jgi:hypothetical protein
LRHEYRDKWTNVHGRQAQLTGADPNHDIGLRHSFGPR